VSEIEQEPVLALELRLQVGRDSGRHLEDGLALLAHQVEVYDVLPYRPGR
jgi:hypothetical protein